MLFVHVPSIGLEVVMDDQVSLLMKYMFAGTFTAPNQQKSGVVAGDFAVPRNWLKFDRVRKLPPGRRGDRMETLPCGCLPSTAECSKYSEYLEYAAEFS